MANVLILDDDQNRAGHWAKSLNLLFQELALDYQADVLSLDEVQANVLELTARRRASRQQLHRDAIAVRIDDADVLVVDYDLLDLGEVGAFVTGDDVAYLARCYSSCKFIVGINQFDKRGKSFDLTLLGHPKEFADLHINDSLLTSQGLWCNFWEGAFRPWSWPVIPAMVDRIHLARSFVRENLKSPLLESLGFASGDVRGFPTRALSFLEFDPSVVDDAKVPSRKLEDLTFQDVVHVRPGLRGRDSIEGPQVEWLVESRLRHLLGEVLIPEQEVLVDIPHLVERLPGVLIDPTDLANWTATCRLSEGLDTLLIPEVLALLRNHPLDTVPTIKQSDLAADGGLLRSLAQRSTNVNRFSFAEDASTFFEPGACTEFLSELELGNSRRNVRQFDGVDYQPATNLAMA